MARNRGRTAARPSALTPADRQWLADQVRIATGATTPVEVAGKSLALPADRTGGRTYTTDQVAGILGQLQAHRGMFAAMPRDPRDDVPFGPLRALVPDPFDPARPDTGRPEPRLAEYAPGFNLPGSSDRLIPWRTLREAVAPGGVDIMRRCIEVRKNRVCGLPWSWRVRPEVVEAAYRADGTRGHDDIAAELRDKWSTEIGRLTAFWEKPWRSQGLDFSMWSRGVMEERLVLDALVLYPQKTYGGDLIGLEIIDGTTVKPLLDFRGARPLPPFPAYQQVIYGFPRGEWTATTVTDDENRIVIDGGFTADQLIYIRENYRSFTPYGFGPTEQGLISARLYLKRQGWMFAEYDEASLGQAYVTLPDTTPLTPQERGAWERSINDELAGQTPARHRLKALFPGMGLVFPPDGAERYKPEYDLFLIKLLAGHYGVPASELGFTETRGLGGAGMHEAMKESQDDSATQPDIAFMEALVNVTSADLLGAPPELFFGYNDPDGEDEKDADAMADARLKRGSITLNDDRTRLGMPRYTFPEADKPFIVGAGGPVFVEGSAAPQHQAAIEHNFDPRAARTPDDPQSVDGPVDRPADAGKVAGADLDALADADDNALQRAAEVSAYRRFARKGARGRPFTWLYHTDVEVAELTKAAGTTEPPEAVDPGKAPPAEEPAPEPDTRWPGWLVDVALAALVATKLRGALAALRDLPVRVVAWAAGGAPTSARGVRTWMTQQGVDTALADRLTFVVREAATEGYAAGARSAQHVLAVGFDGTVDWGGWKPGNVAAARKVLSEDGLTVGLWRLLDDVGVRISKIAAGRLDEVAAVLADGLERGEGVSAIATALRGVLDDRNWAEMTAWTETNRAISAAALDTYRLAGVDGKSWFTAADQRVCPICKANEDQGAIALGVPFASGDEHPPGHPRCRCAVVPEDLPDPQDPSESLAKVGPKGYEHNWVFVGIPGVGGRVRHPHHGHGKITAHEGNEVTVAFDRGHERTFHAAHRPDHPDDFAGVGSGTGPASVSSVLPHVRSTTRATGPQGAVQMADLRDALAARGVTDRAAQDDMIRRSMRAGEIDIDSAMDKHHMTERELAAGIVLGGQTDHWVTPRTDKGADKGADLGKSARAAATGHEGDAERLHRYWTAGEGLAKWRTSPHPWTTLYHHLLRHIRNVAKAKATAAAWYHDATGTWPGAHHGGKH